jgi:hypothetical protein
MNSSPFSEVKEKKKPKEKEALPKNDVCFTKHHGVAEQKVSRSGAKALLGRTPMEHHLPWLSGWLEQLRQSRSLPMSVVKDGLSGLANLYSAEECLLIVGSCRKAFADRFRGEKLPEEEMEILMGTLTPEVLERPLSSPVQLHLPAVTLPISRHPFDIDGETLEEVLAGVEG